MIPEPGRTPIGGVPALAPAPPDHAHVVVWAPAADALAIELAPGPDPGAPATEPSTLGMARHPEDPSWWVAEQTLPHGTAYRIVVDGAAYPDPRSAWQPDGVDGPSVSIDHRRYPWTDSGWRAPPLAAAVIAEIHVGTFTPEGTYAAARRHLPDLVDLGITHIELMPIATFDGHHGWGYDGVDLYAPHPAYGTPDDLKAFVDDCHTHGLAVLVDVVYNHLGPTGNHLGRFGPYFTDRYTTPWGSAVNLDGPGSAPVRRFLVDNALMWLRDYHVDGLRLDAVHALLDTSARHLLEELADDVRRLETALDRPLVLIAENDTNDPRLVRSTDQGGLGLDAHWCEDVHHAIHTTLTGEADSYYADFAAVLGLEVLEPALRQGYVYDGRHSPARDCVIGRPVGTLRGSQLVASIQNHDQIGNRARGERLSHLTSIATQQVAAALLLTAPFVPLLFQGEEWAATSPFPYFADHQDPELAAAVRQGRALEFAAFGWRPDQFLDPEDRATFDLATLRWDERHHGDHARMWRWYRDLIALRRSSPDLLDDRLGVAEVGVDATARTVTVRRATTMVLANLGPDEQDLPGTLDDLVLASATITGDPAAGTIALAPCSVAILRADPIG